MWLHNRVAKGSLAHLTNPMAGFKKIRASYLRYIHYGLSVRGHNMLEKISSMLVPTGLLALCHPRWLAFVFAGRYVCSASSIDLLCVRPPGPSFFSCS